MRQSKKIKKINKETKYSGGAAVYHYGQVNAGYYWFFVAAAIETLALPPFCVNELTRLRVFYSLEF